MAAVWRQERRSRAFPVETTAAERANLCQCPRLGSKIPLIRPIWGPPTWLFLDILQPAGVSGWMLGAVIVSHMRALSSSPGAEGGHVCNHMSPNFDSWSV